MRLIPLAVTFCAAAAWAEDAQLAALKVTLAALRSQASEAEAASGTLGARPELTAAKHQLRDWIETQLGSLEKTADVKEFADRIHAALKGVGATLVEDDQNLLGSLGEVTVTDEPGLVVVTTALGILCQYDISAYGYKFVDGRWKRVWESEQDDYSERKYAPQNALTVHVWQSYKDGQEDGPPFVLTLGNEWGCGSVWHTVYYRVWRVNLAGPKLLIDGSDGAFLRAWIYAVGSIARDQMDGSPPDVLIEFTELGMGASEREAVLHFAIDGDRVRRVDPVALGPRDFVDEWLRSKWDESSAWSATQALRAWYGRLHADWLEALFTGATMHCETPDLWQVSILPHGVPADFKPGPSVHFLVRWRPPYHFRMMDVSDKPWPKCNQEDPEADEWRTLFATQEWRQ